MPKRRAIEVPLFQSRDTADLAVFSALRAGSGSGSVSVEPRRVLDWAMELQQLAEAAIDGGKLSDTSKLLAQHVAERAALVRHFACTAMTTSMQSHEILQAMECAADLAGAWHALAVQDALGAHVGKSVAVTEGGRKGAVRRHAKNATSTANRIAQVVSTMKSARAAGKTRDEICAAVFRKHRVKPSTLKKKTWYRTHLPTARRTRSP